ncbi:hypothetical protein QQS21_003562 [Conoideocrella luteorostrata]|uniref:Phosphoglycerate mutase-like protein n=1 Tax=Conoideocrella luteorostrata TaxID=1105319 RepID=A0AAJ0CT27_9HYPO|nr:hypothetical protein QQS21_003562 [Conoideocrella luteorostrata]
MPPKIVLIRHAQALHNVENKLRPSSPSHSVTPTNTLIQEYSLRDPKLTQLGESQCQHLQESLFQRFGKVPIQDTAVIVSPMIRTMQSATLALDWLVDKLPFEASADWQENSSQPCDTGSPIANPSPFPHITFADLDPVWPDKTSPSARRYFHTRSAIVERGRLVLEALFNRPEKLIFVVSHAGFLRVGVTGCYFMNSDYRIFDFEQGLQDGRRAIKQDESTIEGGLGLSLTKTVPLGEGLPDDDGSISA